MSKWLQIYCKIVDGEKDIPSPFHEAGNLRWIFVYFNEEDRKGYLLIWCSVTNKGVMYGNVRVKEGVGNSVHHSELSKLNLPEIALQQVKM